MLLADHTLLNVKQLVVLQRGADLEAAKTIKSLQDGIQPLGSRMEAAAVELRHMP